MSKRVGTGPWKPMDDPQDIKYLGKMNEECGELVAASSRTMIQGLYEREPTTGKVNKQWLEEELADVWACIELTIEHFDLDKWQIMNRLQHKVKNLKQWHDRT